MSKTCIGASSPESDLSWRTKRDQILNYATHLRAIHPLFSECSFTSKRNGWRHFLKQPSIWEMSDQQWCNQLESETNDYHQYLGLWNRRTANEEALIHTITYGQLGERSGWHIGNIPDLLAIEETMMRILETAIGSFNADIAEIATNEPFEVDEAPLGLSPPEVASWAIERIRAGGHERYAPCYGGLLAPVWKLWLKAGVPFPEPFPPGPGPLQRWQSELAKNSALWLSGQLHTWPEFAPWLLRG